ncbi:MAG: hypothetical protein ACE5I3_00420 [Phycisphaerae bacterium]
MVTVLMVLCAIVIMVMLLRRHQFRATTGRDVAREQLARIRDQHRLRESMDQLLVELEEVSRRVGAQVDTKFAKLDAVIRDADDRIARLEQMLGRHGTEPSQPAAPAKPAAQAALEGGAKDEPPPAKCPDPEPADPRFRRVYELVDAGASPIKAAEELGMPLGEVELILNLRRLR